MDPLAKASADHRRATARTDETREALHEAIRRAVEAGRPQAEIVRVTGYTRERIRQITREADVMTPH